MADRISRKENFLKALALLNESVAVAEPDRLGLAAAIKCFELAYEQAWKFLKAELAEPGQQATTPRETFRKAYEGHWIDDESLWLDMIRDRNDTVHTYKEPIAREIFAHLRARYAAALNALAKR
jgi:nucleotidyltransferase substrate binding protein (TIGR01987 family)